MNANISNFFLIYLWLSKSFVWFLSSNAWKMPFLWIKMKTPHIRKPKTKLSVHNPSCVHNVAQLVTWVGQSHIAHLCCLWAPPNTTIMWPTTEAECPALSHGQTFPVSPGVLQHFSAKLNICKSLKNRPCRCMGDRGGWQHPPNSTAWPQYDISVAHSLGRGVRPLVAGLLHLRSVTLKIYNSL